MGLSAQQWQILAILSVTIVAFLSGRWRHDLIALGALLACVVFGLVHADNAFIGFGHPAVITVACVLVLSSGLQHTGAVDLLAKYTLPKNSGPTLTIGALMTIGALLSSFMNNVGAMALLMPLAIQLSGRLQLTPGKILMPLAFGTILGGMTTLIGTPPNLIVSGFRSQAGLGHFGMFDFTPIGVMVAAVGVTFVALIAWRWIPNREPKDKQGFEAGSYLTETLVPEDSAAIDKTLGKLQQELDRHGAQVVSMVRNEFRVFAPYPNRRIMAGDILVIEAEPSALSSALTEIGLEIQQENPPKAPGEEEPIGPDRPPSKGELAQIGLQEFVVLPNSLLVGRSAREVQLSRRYALKLLAISRQGRRSIKRLRWEKLQAGDVLLVQGNPEALAGFGNTFNAVPLANRDIRIPNIKRAALAASIMLTAILVTAVGLTTAPVAFSIAVIGYVVADILPIRKVYDSIDWPVIVLLACLMPVAGAMASTGTASWLASVLLENVAQGHPIIALTLMLVVTMTLSDFMNNAATAAVMCPIAISTAQQLSASPDPFLMAVAIGASCSFLTPIGHQNNTLILGPAGFKFGDYWRLGLPMEILVVIISIPLLQVVWPL
ncbi:SLC13 family permease [Paraferrimonas sedimenticola]|uniref:SLC13 family permease n=1 Tax=Paraferrimonas sedimenticola TaxID=375674 RepID=A0AA37RVL2_9GAMM|nr:SLC13 family permease [Paraferrimonas sedimenticola]GLP96031.1 SLC13 family permease [Paraferrimonas sedimenticola]